MNGLNGKRVLVTGAASGIGAGIASRLVEEGCTVGGIDLQPSEAITPFQLADVRAWNAVEPAVAAIAEKLGGLDAAVNVAGIGGYSGDVVETTLEDWQKVIDVDLTGVFLVSRAAIPFIRKSGGGSLAHISSQYGLVGGAGFPAYCAAKAGVIGLTRAMAVDHAGEGIRVNCVCPGPIETPMLARNRLAPGRDRERERTEGRVLLGRPGEPADVAALVAFLLSEDARNITGSIMTSDGGWTAG
jgi:meso-butanediol dehydrogenase/(S,S)-butanediol dehydrogenase/diacetyl reductase